MNSVFIHIPKTGGLTIQAALNLQILRYPHRARQNFKQKGNVTFGHLPYLKYVSRGIISKKFNDTAFKYAFCRLPYDRAVSHYFYARQRSIQVIPEDMSFLDFTRSIKDYKRHFRTQAYPIKNIKLDFIGRFESLEQDIRKIGKIIGVKVGEIPHANKTKHKPYWTYYCEESKENIEKFYKEDFETFNYGFDSNLLHRK